MKNIFKLIITFCIVLLPFVTYSQNVFEKYPSNDLVKLYSTLIKNYEFYFAGFVRLELKKRNIELKYSNKSIDELRKIQSDVLLQKKSDLDIIFEIDIEINMRNIYLPKIQAVFKK